MGRTRSGRLASVLGGENVRLIDADALKEIISGNSYILRDSINSMNFGMFWDGIEQAIDESPTIDAVPATLTDTLCYLHEVGWMQEHDKFLTKDVAPVRHGRWVVIDAEEPRRYGCSECKRLSWHMENYCGNCGARMDGESND